MPARSRSRSRSRSKSPKRSVGRSAPKSKGSRSPSKWNKAVKSAYSKLKRANSPSFVRLSPTSKMKRAVKAAQKVYKSQ